MYFIFWAGQDQPNVFTREQNGTKIIYNSLCTILQNF